MFRQEYIKLKEKIDIQNDTLLSLYNPMKDQIFEDIFEEHSLIEEECSFPSILQKTIFAKC